MPAISFLTYRKETVCVGVVGVAVRVGHAEEARQPADTRMGEVFSPEIQQESACVKFGQGNIRQKKNPEAVDF